MPAQVCKFPARTAKKDRLPGLEWLRVGLTLAVVALHAGMAYLIHPFPGLTWSTYDNPSIAAECVCWTANAIVMPGFFLLGGFGAAGLVQRLGPADMAWHRLKRLGGPFVLGCLLVLPLDLYAWLLGWVADGRIPIQKLRSLKVDNGLEAGLWGVSHLWFLQYLLLFCVMLAGWKIVCGRFKWLAVLGTRVAPSPFLVLVLAAGSAAALWFDPQILLGFRHSWYPLPAHCLFYLPIFAFGATCFRLEPSRYAGLKLGVGVVLLVITTPSRDVWLDGSATDAVTRGVATLGYTSAGWFLAVGLFDLARRWNKPMPKPVAYLAAASFWIYLIHHPVVGLTHVTLKPLLWAPSTKFAATILIALWVSLGTFEVAVRRTWIGQVLGVRRPAPVNAVDRPKLAENEMRTAA